MGTEEQLRDAQRLVSELDDAERRHHELTQELTGDLSAAELSKIQSAHDAAADAHHASLQTLLDKVSELEVVSRSHADRDASVDPAEEAATLRAHLDERERELAEKHRELAALTAEDEALSDVLRSLVGKAARVTKELREDRGKTRESMRAAWARERAQLVKTLDQDERTATELAWHVNRGSHIKRKATDPRVPKGMIGPSHAHEADARLRDDVFLTEHRQLSAALTDQQADKVAVNRRHTAIAEQWMGKGKSKPVEGTKPWYDREIGTLKALLQREEKETKDLVDRNFRLKAEKADAESKTQDLRKTITERLVQDQRQKKEAARRRAPEWERQ
eukprot:TRINITY_DN1331_c1_g4_i1.p1 TRINITY_DN1331_c1_g4~~TRINITY_DN1331_c1_g4_i1.p1  ORF type:complete len:361 (+),score=163.37 TRINITY_DN1331_c1_g4_i1:83-1084(+)